MSFRDRARQRLQERSQAAQPAGGQEEQDAPPDDQQPADSDQPVEAGSDQSEYVAELEQLAKLKNDGIITDEEFAAKKKQILGI